MPDQHPDLDRLTERELQILTRITNEMTNAEIAEDLFLTINTVKTHIRGLYATIGVESRVQAVVWGVRHGLLDPLPDAADAAADMEQA